MFEGGWNDITPASYIVEARQRISSIWLGKPVAHHEIGYFEPFSTDILANIFNISRTKARECIISSADDWLDFISDSLFPSL